MDVIDVPRFVMEAVEAHRLAVAGHDGWPEDRPHYIQLDTLEPLVLTRLSPRRDWWMATWRERGALTGEATTNDGRAPDTWAFALWRADDRYVTGRLPGHWSMDEAHRAAETLMTRLP